MPRFDGTGPAGMGPGTGRGFGPCFGPCSFYGRKRGLGKYFTWGWPEGKDERKKFLADYKKALEEELEDVKKEEGKLNKKG